MSNEAVKHVIIPSAGDPIELAKVLQSNLETFSKFNHDDVQIILMDDATSQTNEVQRVVDKLNETFSGRIIRISEFNADGTNGKKQVLREKLREYNFDLTEKHFGKGLTGTANEIFWLFQGKQVFWLEQDAILGELNNGTVDTSSDIEQITEHVKYQATFSTEDLITHDFITEINQTIGKPISSLVDDIYSHNQTYESESYNSSIEKRIAHDADINMAVFHQTGHQDFRARMNALLLLDEKISEDNIDALLNGDFPFYGYSTAKPTEHVLHNPRSVFGTSIVFDKSITKNMLMMPTTRLRYIDFAVGEIAKTNNDIYAWVSANSLTHIRQAKTESGRGPICNWMYEEDCMWPVAWRLEDACNESSLLGYRILQKELKIQKDIPIDHVYCLNTITQTLELALKLLDTKNDKKIDFGHELLKKYSINGFDKSNITESALELNVKITSIMNNELDRLDAQLDFWNKIQDIKPPNFID